MIAVLLWASFWYFKISQINPFAAWTQRIATKKLFSTDCIVWPIDYWYIRRNNYVENFTNIIWKFQFILNQKSYIHYYEVCLFSFSSIFTKGSRQWKWDHTQHHIHVFIFLNDSIACIVCETMKKI